MSSVIHGVRGGDGGGGGNTCFIVSFPSSILLNPPPPPTNKKQRLETAPLEVQEPGYWRSDRCRMPSNCRCSLMSLIKTNFSAKIVNFPLSLLAKVHAEFAIC